MKQTNKGLNRHKNIKHPVAHAVNLPKHSAYRKLRLAFQCLTTLKIVELLLTADSPNISDLTIWRVIVSG